MGRLRSAGRHTCGNQFFPCQIIQGHQFLDQGQGKVKIFPHSWISKPGGKTICRHYYGESSLQKPVCHCRKLMWPAKSPSTPVVKNHDTFSFRHSDWRHPKHQILSRMWAKCELLWLIGRHSLPLMPNKMKRNGGYLPGQCNWANRNHELSATRSPRQSRFLPHHFQSARPSGKHTHHSGQVYPPFVHPRLW